jgi:hypothetical protein
VTQFTIAKEVTAGQVQDAFIFIDMEGTAHCFPFDAASKQNIIRALSGGVHVATSMPEVLR